MAFQAPAAARANSPTPTGPTAWWQRYEYAIRSWAGAHGLYRPSEQWPGQIDLVRLQQLGGHLPVPALHRAAAGTDRPVKLRNDDAARRFREAGFPTTTSRR